MSKLDLGISFGPLEQLAFAAAGAAINAMSSSLPEDMVRPSKILVNLALFMAPTAMVASNTHNNELGASIALFAFAGLVVGAERNSCIMGVRRENWFHYCIAAASVGISRAL